MSGMRGHKTKPNAVLQVGPARRRDADAIERQLAPLRKMHRSRYSKKMIKEALIASNGIVSRAAKQLGCSRTTIFDWLKKHPDLDQEYQDLRESYVDLAESSLLSQVAEKNTQATIFLLRCLGRNRGWSDAPQQHVHAMAPVGSGTWFEIMQRAIESGTIDAPIDLTSDDVKMLPSTTEHNEN